MRLRFAAGAYRFRRCFADFAAMAVCRGQRGGRCRSVPFDAARRVIRRALPRDARWRMILGSAADAAFALRLLRRKKACRARARAAAGHAAIFYAYAFRAASGRAARGVRW